MCISGEIQGFFGFLDLLYCPSSLEKNFKFVSIEGGIISSSIDLWLLLWKEDVPTYLKDSTKHIRRLLLYVVPFSPSPNRDF